MVVDVQDRLRDWERSQNHYGHYALELLEHAGVPHTQLARGDLLAASLPAIVLLPYALRLGPAEVAALESHVRSGGAVVCCGGVEGADELFGVRTSRRYLKEAVLKWPEGALGLSASRIPVWGVQLAEPPDDSGSAGEGAFGEVHEVTAQWGESAEGQSTGGQPAVRQPAEERPDADPVARQCAHGLAARFRGLGDGFTCYLAFDVPRSVVTMQQGAPVMGDGPSSADGTAPIQDRLLKADDGAVIDWSLRQETPEGPAFATAYADLLRELLLGAVAECSQRLRVPLPLAWYWPHALPAIATLSFDTDSNEGPDGWAFLEHLEELDVAGTWCVMYPGGYPRELYEAIEARGDEIALHYDGLTSDLASLSGGEVEHCGWAWEDFHHQFAWLVRETGVERVVSQKNHVTRWEGWVELFRWVERAGIAVEQSKGPSKIGNMGFTFGTCHLWRPIDDLRNENRVMDLLELPFLSHDMHHSQKRVEMRRFLVDAVKERAGVAHFVFHPQRIHEEGMREALADVVSYAREQGLEWWTSERLAEWEMARRAATVSVKPEERGTLVVELENAPEGLTLHLPGIAVGTYGADIGVQPEWVDLYGQRVLRLTLPAGTSRVRLAREQIETGET
ncbi:MAG: hypothetical protein WD273_15500 [Trueperaceae bacterium]